MLVVRHQHMYLVLVKVVILFLKMMVVGKLLVHAMNHMILSIVFLMASQLMKSKNMFKPLLMQLSVL